MSADIVCGLDVVRKKYLARKRSIEGKFEIFKTISQSKEFLYFITLQVIFISRVDSKFADFLLLP